MSRSIVSSVAGVVPTHLEAVAGSEGLEPGGVAKLQAEIDQLMEAHPIQIF